MSIASLLASLDRRRLSSQGGGGAAPGLDDLTRFIPTETITLYVASLAMAANVRGGRDDRIQWAAYVAWAILTPTVVYLIALGAHRKSCPAASGMAVPRWAMCASTFAFLVWALAVPGLIHSDQLKVLAAFGALVVSKFLSLLEPIFGPHQ